MSETPSRPSDFIFVICQAGAEAAARKEMLGIKTPAFGPLKLAFSRPGFLTFKVDPEAPPSTRYTLPSTLSRTCGWSLGKVTGSDAAKLVSEICENDVIRPCKTIHVYERETRVPGSDGFEPGISALAAHVGEMIEATEYAKKNKVVINRTAPADSMVGDVVIVNPDEWWFGFHHAVTRAGRWPGGVPVFDTGVEHVSRAYFKLKEALLWSGITINPGDVCAEIGSAPGGACELLLETGAKVIGIDPAEMDIEHEDLTYIRRRGHEVKKRDFSDVRWLLADLNMQPRYTLDTVRDIVKHDVVNVSGIVMTLKTNDWDLIDKVPGYISEVKKWGFQVVRARQLAFNRREFCLMAIKDKFVLRDSKRKGWEQSATVGAEKAESRAQRKPEIVEEPEVSVSAVSLADRSADGVSSQSVTANAGLVAAEPVAKEKKSTGDSATDGNKSDRKKSDEKKSEKKEKRKKDKSKKEKGRKNKEKKSGNDKSKKDKSKKDKSRKDKGKPKDKKLKDKKSKDRKENKEKGKSKDKKDKSKKDKKGKDKTGKDKKSGDKKSKD